MFKSIDMMWFIPVMTWSIFWKGIALWRSARSSEKYWFIALLFINTIGILEICYLFLFAKSKLVLTDDVSPSKGKSRKAK